MTPNAPPLTTAPRDGDIRINQEQRIQSEEWCAGHRPCARSDASGEHGHWRGFGSISLAQYVEQFVADRDDWKRRAEAAERSSALDFELLKDFDVYGTGGDVSSCIREIKMQLSEARTAVDTARTELNDMRKAWAILDEPGEALRHAHTATEAATQFRAKLDAARGEAERLRMAIGLMTTAKPTMAMRADDPIGMAREVAAETERLRADVARLREALDSAKFFWRGEYPGDGPTAKMVTDALSATADSAKWLEAKLAEARNGLRIEWLAHPPDWMLARELAARDTAHIEMREHVVRCIDETEPIQHKTVGDALRRRDAKVKTEALREAARHFERRDEDDRAGGSIAPWTSIEVATEIERLAEGRET